MCYSLYNNIIVIELNEEQFGLNSNACLQNHKFDFRPKLHYTKCNCHFIIYSFLNVKTRHTSCFPAVLPHMWQHSKKRANFQSMIIPCLFKTLSKYSTCLCIKSQKKSKVSLNIFLVLLVI